MLFVATYAHSADISGQLKPNSSIKIYEFMDFISHKTNLIAETKADSIGNFNLTFKSNKPQQILIECDGDFSKLFTEDGGIYVLKDIVIKDKYKILIHREINSGINVSILKIERETADIGYNLAMNEDDFFVIRKKLDEMRAKYTNNNHDYIDRAANYIIANIELNLLLKDRSGDPIGIIDGFIEKWFHSREMMLDIPYFTGTYDFALASRCNLDNYFNKKSNNCEPSNKAEIENMTSFIPIESYKKMAIMNFLSKIAMKDKSAAVKIINSYPENYFSPFEEVVKRILE